MKADRFPEQLLCSLEFYGLQSCYLLELQVVTVRMQPDDCEGNKNAPTREV